MSMHKTYLLALLLAVFGTAALAAGNALAADPLSGAVQQNASRRLGASSQIPASQAAMRGQYGAVPQASATYPPESVPNVSQPRIEGSAGGMVRPATVDPAPIAAPPA